MSNFIPERKTNFEILRIFSMLMIIAYHIVCHSGILEASFSINNNIAHFFNVGGEIGVLIFVLISGYFLIETEFRIRRIIYIVFETWLYSFVIFLSISVFITSDFSMKRLIPNFFPILFAQYWFVTAYLGMYILSPFVNILIYHLSKRQYALLLAILFTMFSLIPLYPSIDPFKPSYLLFFIFIYLVAGFLKKYWMVQIENRMYLYLFGILFTAMYLTYPIFTYLSQFHSTFKLKLIYYASLMSPFTLLSAICLFLYFKNIPYKKSGFINLIASTTLGIYLIHANNLLHPYIWKWLKVEKYFYTPYFILALLTNVVIIFTVCCVIDLVRRILFEKLFSLTKFKKSLQKIDTKINSFFFTAEASASDHISRPGQNLT